MANQGADFHELQAKLPAFIEKYEGKALRSTNSWEEFYLRPLHNIHLHSDLKGVAKSACGSHGFYGFRNLLT